MLNQISAVFPIVRFPGDRKTALTGESLYFKPDIQSRQLLLRAYCSNIYCDYRVFKHPNGTGVDLHFVKVSEQFISNYTNGLFDCKYVRLFQCINGILLPKLF